MTTKVRQLELYCDSQNQYGSGKDIVIDSGFCVLKGLVELKKVGIFAHALIKKR